MTIRSGKIVTPLNPIPNEDLKVVQEDNPESHSDAPTRHVEEKSTPCLSSEENKSPPIKPYQPPLPFPGRARQDEHNEDYNKSLEHIKSLEINIPFIESVAQMPKYAKFLKDLLTNRKKMEEASKVGLNENCQP